MIILVSGIPFRFILKGLKAVLFLLIFLAVFNTLMTPGEVLAQWGIFKITGLMRSSKSLQLVESIAPSRYIVKIPLFSSWLNIMVNKFYYLPPQSKTKSVSRGDAD